MSWSRVTPIELTDSRSLHEFTSLPSRTAEGQGAPLEQWAVRAQEGDSAAFHRVYESCAPAVHALLRASLPADSVEDAHQEVFLAAWSALPRYRSQTPFRPWLFGIARNVARRSRRQAKRSRVVSMEDWQAVPEPSAADSQQQAQQVLRAIAQRPERQRVLLSLRLIEGLSPSEIAVYLDSTPGSVRVRLHRALASLRAQLETES